ncbi:shufflon system plasmid conjugative transfer pilus tip adhesin PilV [Pseudomonas putida]
MRAPPNGRVRAGEYLEVAGVASEGSGCAPAGLIGRDAYGGLLSCKNGMWQSNAGSVYASSQSHLAPGSVVSCIAGPTGRVLIQASYSFTSPSPTNQPSVVYGYIHDASTGALLASGDTTVMGISTSPARASSDTMPLNYLDTGLVPGVTRYYRLSASQYAREVSYWCLSI